MSLAAFPFEHLAKDHLSANMNSVCEAPQFFPLLAGHSTSIPTPEEAEQLSFFDQWLANDYQGSTLKSSEELISTIDDFEIIPYDDPTGMSPENINALNMPMIDSSMFSDFPSPSGHSQFDLLSDFSSEANLLASCENMMSPAYNLYLDAHSPVNIQLPSPVQTPRLSPLPSKDLSVPSLANCETKPLGRKSSKRANSEDTIDDVITKRQRNTDAARRSRQRKVHRLDELEKRTSELLTENTRLSTKVAILESEKVHQRQKELELRIRIQTLENQLSEAHRALTER